MGQQVGGVPEDAPLTGESRGIGAYLARQRRLRGISLDDLSALTKIPRRSLERLESGAFDGQADGFSRGFVRTVAQALGLEAEDAVLRLLGEPAEADPGAASGGAWWLRVALIGAALAALSSAVAVAIWWLATFLAPDASVPEDPPVVYRRDAVRALAESQALRDALRESDATEATDAPDDEPVDSPGDDAAHPGADPALGGHR